MRQENSGREQQCFAHLSQGINEDFNVCINLRFRAICASEAFIEFRNKRNKNKITSVMYAVFIGNGILPVCIISRALLKNKHYAVCQQCLKTQWGSAGALLERICIRPLRNSHSVNAFANDSALL